MMYYIGVVRGLSCDDKIVDFKLTWQPSPPLQDQETQHRQSQAEPLSGTWAARKCPIGRDFVGPGPTIFYPKMLGSDILTEAKM
jgi:hypothetical protein